MNRIYLLVLILVWPFWSSAQRKDPIKKYRKVIGSYSTISYDVQRMDTFPDGSSWHHFGHGILVRNDQSSLLHAGFMLTRPDLQLTYLFNGKLGFRVDHKTKTYKIDAAPYLPSVLGSPAGQMLVAELLAIDTTYIRTHTAKTNGQLLLTFDYADVPAVDERERSTTIYLDNRTQRLQQVRTRVVKGGGYWTTTYILSKLRINQAQDKAAINQADFLSSYTLVNAVPKPAAPTLVGTTTPAFRLPRLGQGVPVTLSDYRGKLILLDFWTTSCSPCISSMPEIQLLHTKYEAQGLVVISVLMDPQNVTRAAGILQRQGVTYINLLGDQVVEKLYHVDTYPRYVLINQNSTISYDEAGFNSQLESVIRQELKKER